MGIRSISTQQPKGRLKLKHFIVIGSLLFGVQVLYFHKQVLPHNISLDLDWNSYSYTTTTTSYEYTKTGASLLSNAASNATRAHTYNNNTKKRQPDGTFNGYPIFYQETKNHPIYSDSHCVGESYEPPFFWRSRRKHIDMTWQHRSCHYQFFCFDTDTKQYIIYPDPKEMEAKFSRHFDVQQSFYMNNTPEGNPYAVSLGGINQKWTHKGITRLKWYPQVRLEPPSSFYALPTDVVLLPFHSLASFNPGHLVWDDYLPIYTLMQIFQLDHLDLLLMRYKLPDPGLWAGCDWKRERSEECTFMLEKFGPLMMRNHDALPITTQEEPKFQVHGDHASATMTGSSTPPSSSLVCARNGLVGLGSLTDHGTGKGHGWEANDYKKTHNHGRGGQFWRFRTFMMENLGLTTTEAPPPAPYLIVFSEKLSKIRSLSFYAQINALQEVIGDDVRIETHQMKHFTVKEQAELVSKAAIYVTGCGGGAVTSTFLPRGSSLFVFFPESGGVENNRNSGKPARLDWDYFNNMAYTRVHWISQVRKDFKEDLEGFVQMIQHDLNIIRRERQEYEALL